MHGTVLAWWASSLGGGIAHWGIADWRVVLLHVAGHIALIRTYVTVDIIIRILREFFGTNVWHVLNITDVDDKIIKRVTLSTASSASAILLSSVRMCIRPMKRACHR